MRTFPGTSKAVTGAKRQRALSLAALAALIVATCAMPAAGEITPGPAPTTPPERDGSHDFDPLLGKWKYHLRRLVNPLTGSKTWIDLEGTGVCRPIFDGAQIDQIVVDGDGTHIEGLTLRTYNPQSHQWSLYWANRKVGKLDVPQIGQFKEGHGEFYAQDILNGKAILIRFDWTGLATKSPHFEQAFSADGGKTWEVNWITDQVKVSD
ncbi:MAG TPA: hypothetical protein VKE50_01645 [Thermoanaerobaculia bacterium]|nr:hypothetical protein [Thermoanaerobaculia bacterium]